MHRGKNRAGAQASVPWSPRQQPYSFESWEHIPNTPRGRSFPHCTDRNTEAQPREVTSLRSLSTPAGASPPRFYPLAQVIPLDGDSHRDTDGMGSSGKGPL